MSVMTPLQQLRRWPIVAVIAPLVTLCLAVAGPSRVAEAAPPVFTGLAPARLLDTRPGLATVDGQLSGVGPLGAGGIIELPVTGRGGVPTSDVAAVALNVTATGATAPSYLTAFPSGGQRPVASNLNFEPGRTTANMVIVAVGADNRVALFNHAGSVDVIVDVLGWFGAGAGFTTASPSRLLDTRSGAPTVDGAFSGSGRLAPGATFDLQVLGRGLVPATGVGAVALNVTAVEPTAASYVTVYPTGRPRPTASNLNLSPRRTTPNMVIVPIGADGRITIYNFAGSVDIVVDVLGAFDASSGFTGITPHRLIDTRQRTWPTSSEPLPVHDLWWETTLGEGGVPATGVSAVVLNVTIVEPSQDTYLTVFPRGAARPTASNVNATAGEIVPNLVIVPVSAKGQIALYNFAGTTHVIVDILGYITGPPYSRPATHAFRCSDTLMRGQLLVNLRSPGSAPTNNWGWWELGAVDALTKGTITVHMFDPAAGIVVASVDTLTSTNTLVYQRGQRIGGFEQYTPWRGGGIIEFGDPRLAYESYLNPTATVRLALTSNVLSLQSCTHP